MPLSETEWTNGRNELAEYQCGVKASRMRGTTEWQRCHSVR
ncbi:hypothetical protein [Rubritalea tangerina]